MRVKSILLVSIGILCLVFIAGITSLLPSPSPAGMLNLGSGKTPIRVMPITQPATASSMAITGPGAFGGIILLTDGTNNVTVNIYDNDKPLPDGNKLIPTNTVFTGTTRIWALGYDPPTPVSLGVYVTISVAGGGTCSYQILYDQG